MTPSYVEDVLFMHRAQRTYRGKYQDWSMSATLGTRQRYRL